MTGNRRPLILVLEDEAVVAMELETRLRGLGYRIAGPCSDAESALAVARAERPDLLLADIRLSGSEDGVDVANRLRRELGIPAVYLSAYADGSTLARAVASDPFGYLTKPLRESELHATITTALHRDRLEKALAQRERELALSEARFRAVFDASPDAMLVVGEQEDIRLANLAAASLFQSRPELLIGKPVRSLICCDTLDLQTPRLVSGQTRTEPRIPVEINIQLSSRESGLGKILAVRDVSDRVRHQAEIQKLAAIIEHAREAICLCTLEGSVVFLNEAGERLFGSKTDQAHELEDFAPESFRPMVRGEILPKLRAGGSWEGELQLTNLQTGSVADVHFTSFSISSGVPGEASFLACVALDITARKQAERALAESLEQLQRGQKAEALGRLAGGVAHDFGNMLTVILGLSRLLGPLLAHEPHAQALVRDIHDAGSRSYNLVQRLLAFARSQPIPAQALDLNAQVREFSRLLAHVLRANIQLTVEASDEPYMVWVQRTQLEQVLLNLVLNARDAMPKGGRLWVRTRRAARSKDPSQDGYILEVEDEGHGMTDDVQRRLFEPFFTTKGPELGTGLGLSVVYGVVTQMSGEISVHSVAGQGSTFRIWLPAYENQTTNVGRGASEVSALNEEIR